jgi:integrase
MGIYKRDQERGDHSYWISWLFNGRRYRKRIGSSSKKTAEAVLAKIKTEIAEGKFLDRKKERKIKFRDLADTYMEKHAKPNKRSWKSTDQGLVNNLVAFFGDRHIHEIDVLLVEDFKAERRKHVSSATVNRSLSCLRCMFNRAIDWDILTSNPMRKVKRLPEKNKRLRFLERHEIVRLLNCCRPLLRAVITVAIHTGMRKAEITNLKWRDVDFKRDLITLLKTKNGKARYILLNKPAKDALVGVLKNSESEFIFCKKDGSRFNVRKSFETACKKAKIQDFRFHDLRHTFASHLAMSGVDLITIKELLGHETLEMTQRYAHLTRDHKASAVASLRNLSDTYSDTKANVDKNVEFDRIVSHSFETV